MKNILITTALVVAMAGTAFAGQQFNSQVSGESCEMKPVANSNLVQRVDPTCGNVRTSKTVSLRVQNVSRDVITETVKARGVADGSVQTGPNLTSMGNAISDGKTIVRVRTTATGRVVIEKAGNGVVFDGEVGAGDTLVEVPGGGTYIAKIEGRSFTKATGPQTFDDVAETVTTVTETKVTREVGDEDNGG